MLASSFAGSRYDNPFHEAVKTKEEREEEMRAAMASFEAQIFGPKARQAHEQAERESHGSGG